MVLQHGRYASFIHAGGLSYFQFVEHCESWSDSRGTHLYNSMYEYNLDPLTCIGYGQHCHVETGRNVPQRSSSHHDKG